MGRNDGLSGTMAPNEGLSGFTKNKSMCME